MSTQQAQLQHVNKEISSIRHSLHFAKIKREQCQQNLATTEKKIGETAKQIRSLSQQIQILMGNLNDLVNKKDKDQARLKKQTALLNEQLRVAYKMGQHEYLKLLLNQADPAVVGRVLKYLNYISQARLAIIHSIEKTIASLNQTQKQIERKTQLLTRLKTQEKTQRDLFLHYKASRLEVLKKLNQTIATKLSRLQYLKSNKVALSHVIKKLQQQARLKIIANARFGKMRGHLHWPIVGSILKRFGAQIEHSHLRSNGVLIAAKVGSSVRAIYPGKVVFANWLTGYGLLIIVQHGKHYMTLYGHNQTLYKRKGDLIKAGDLLATVGNSGGFSKSGLYFEIRHDGNPVNPERWCRG